MTVLIFPLSQRLRPETLLQTAVWVSSCWFPDPHKQELLKQLILYEDEDPACGSFQNISLVHCCSRSLQSWSWVVLFCSTRLFYFFNAAVSVQSDWLVMTIFDHHDHFWSSWPFLIIMTIFDPVFRVFRERTFSCLWAGAVFESGRQSMKLDADLEPRWWRRTMCWSEERTDWTLRPNPTLLCTSWSHLMDMSIILTGLMCFKLTWVEMVCFLSEVPWDDFLCKLAQ